MRLEINKIPNSKEYELNEVVLLNEEKYPPHFPIAKIGEVKVNVKARKYENFLNVNISLNAKVNLICSYSLKEFESTIKNSDSLNFAFYKEEADEDTILIEGNYLNLDQYIYDLIILGVPLKPIAPGAKLPEGDNSYRVISSDDYESKKASEGNSKFDKLLDLDLD